MPSNITDLANSSGHGATDNVTSDVIVTTVYPYLCKFETFSVVTEVVTWGLSIFQVYLTIVLIYYAWIVNSLKTRIRTGEERFGIIFSRLLLTSSIFAFFRIFLNVDAVWNHPDIEYTVLKVLKYIGTTIAIGTLYSILWLRQKVLYTHRLTDHLSSCFTKCLVWSVLASLACTCLLVGTFFIYPDTEAYSPFECLFHPGQTPFAFIKWIILLLSMGFFQILLLSLFVYPLVRQRKAMDLTTKQAKANDVYKNVIKRVIFSTVVCMLTDLIVTVITLGMKDIIDHDTTDFLFDVSLFVNEMSIFYSFGDWKAKLFPWLPSSRKLREQQRRGVSFHQSKPQVSYTGQSRGSSG